MKKYIVFIIILMFSIHTINSMSINDVNNRISEYHYNCSSRIVLLKAINETVKNTNNVTVRKTLIEIGDLFSRLDCDTINKIYSIIYSYGSSNELGHSSKSYNNITDSSERYVRLESVLSNEESGITIPWNNEKYVYITNTSRIENNGIDPFIIAINILSITSFVIGIYIFRIIKKRIDYI